MCGIVGLAGFGLSGTRSRELVDAMARRIHHRGPDGGGTVANDDAAIGMKRLAIVDVENGHQPMLNDDGSVAIVFNGEIYNAPSLRDRLRKAGVVFHTRSDTEVLLRLYEQAPDDLENHLAGMWAFAIHDRRRRCLVLSRDRFGIKPLFFTTSTRGLAFASELCAFDRAFDGISSAFSVNLAAAHAMLSWSFVPETASIYVGVERLGPGHRLTFDLASGKRSIVRYWTLVPSAAAAQIRTLNEACEMAEPLLRNAVREHLESDVPLATFLSGGIDSSLITYYALEASSRPIKAYSIGFEDARFDESPFARRTAEILGVESLVATFDEATARARLADALIAYDEPFGDSSSLATYLLCHHVAADYKVALGGDGGDEVFAGYKKYQVTNLRRPFRAHPGLRDKIGSLLGRIPTRTDRTRGWTELLRTLRRLSRGLNGPDAEVYAQLTQVAPLARTAELMQAPTTAELYLESARERFLNARGSELQRTLTGDLGNTLCNDMLVKVDRASMANHLEARIPFLDHRVVEFGLGLPHDLALGLNGKRVLRTLHERIFGRALARRPKMGFGVPVETWLRGPLDATCSLLFDARRLDRFGILSQEALSHGRHRELARTDPTLLWHAFALASWCEINLGDGAASFRELVDGSLRQPARAGKSGGATGYRRHA